MQPNAFQSSTPLQLDGGAAAPACSSSFEALSALANATADALSAAAGAYIAARRAADRAQLAVIDVLSDEWTTPADWDARLDERERTRAAELAALDRLAEVVGALQAATPPSTAGLQVTEVEHIEAAPAPPVTPDMVDRFLTWPLPFSVCADLCATHQSDGRTGTNLLTALEARAMLEHVLAVPEGLRTSNTEAALRARFDAESA